MQFALFRELLQNSCDAKATCVNISFKTDRAEGLSITDMSKINAFNATSLTVKNNGLSFSDNDWSRLRELTKGNPSETDMGKHGIGLYSTFELSNTPLIHSGSTAMSFFFDKDQLCFQEASAHDSGGWTIIDLPYTKKKQLPYLPFFAEFLIQSFVFLPLQTIELQLDGIRILNLQKTLSSVEKSPAPNNELNCVSPKHKMELKEVELEECNLSISYINTTGNNDKGIFGFGAAKSPAYCDLSCLFLKVTGKISTHGHPSFVEDVETAIMKPLPKEAFVSVVSEIPSTQEIYAHPIHELLFPSEHFNAKVHIGFPTIQTTSLKFHLSSEQFIPTVDKAAIEMDNYPVYHWNNCLLHMAGLIVRILYSHEAKLLHKNFPSDDYLQLAGTFMNKYVFDDTSRPSASVRWMVKDGFWNDHKDILVPTQHGMAISSETRIAAGIKLFKKRPILIEDKISQTTVSNTASSVKYFEPEDVMQEVKEGPFTIEQFSELLQVGFIDYKNRPTEFAKFKDILQNTTVCLGDAKNTIIPASEFDSYQDFPVVPNDFPLPPYCLSKDMRGPVTIPEIESLCPYRFTLSDWVVYAASAKEIPEHLDIRKSVDFAETALHRVAEFWASFSGSDRNEVVNAISDVACVPTQHGLKIPSDAYVGYIKVCPDLSIVSAKLTKYRKFLSDIGVRKTAKVEALLDVINNPPKSERATTIVNIVKYLCAYESSISLADWKILQAARIFSSVDDGLYTAGDLLSPNGYLKLLDFRCLDWLDWVDDSAEAKFLFKLGLKKYPSQESILEIADFDNLKNVGNTKENRNKCDMALIYYYEHFERNNYKSLEGFRLSPRCIPCTKNGKLVKEKPIDCYTDSDAAPFGVPVVVDTFKQHAYKFGIKHQTNALAHHVIAHLRNHPPESLESAKNQIFLLVIDTARNDPGPYRKLEKQKFYPSQSQPKRHL